MMKSVINKESSEIRDQLDRHRHKLLNDTLFHEMFYFLWHKNYKPTHFPIISFKVQKNLKFRYEQAKYDPILSHFFVWLLTSTRKKDLELHSPGIVMLK